MSYFDWLVYLIAPDYRLRDDHMELLFALYSIEFFWVLPRDRNRAEDGLELRDKFKRETEAYGDYFEAENGPCNCLEMFVALAIRCEKELMYNPDEGDQTWRWFWMMMENLGLDIYTDDDFDFDDVDHILWRFMSRKYGPNLEYCAFPCSISMSKMSKTELTYQLNYYVREKFY